MKGKVSRGPGFSRFGRALAIAAAALGCGLLTMLQTPAGAQGAGKHAAGRILVQFANNADSQARANVLARLGAASSEQIGKLPIHIIHLQQNGKEADAAKTARSLKGVAYAEVDQAVAPSEIPNDPSYPSQWHLAKIAAPTAWDVTTGSTGLTVAILDTGCDPTHPDLAANYVAGYNFYDGNTDTHDVYGHGTAVAGCVGAVGDNSVGVASVDWHAKIMPCRISDTSGYGYYSTVIAALQWAADHGARVANVSYDFQDSSSFLTAADYFASKGGMVVCSAGNAGCNNGYPSRPSIMCISATDSNDALASWSCYGPGISLAAPGVSIYTTANGGGYRSASGTSFSSPITAGAFALAWSANPSLTATQVRRILESTADDLGAAGWDQYFGNGRVNVARAVQAAISVALDTEPPSVYLTNPLDGSTVSGTLSLAATASDNVGVVSVSFYVDGSLLATSTSAPYGASWDTTAVANGAHTLSASAVDTSGNVATTSTITVNVQNAGDTTPPICAITSPTNGAVVSRSFSVTVKASDNVGVVRVQLLVDGKVTCTASGPTSFTVNSRKWSSGTHVLTAIAYDAAGNQGVSAAVNVTR